MRSSLPIRHDDVGHLKVLEGHNHLSEKAAICCGMAFTIIDGGRETIVRVRLRPPIELLRLGLRRTKTMTKAEQGQPRMRLFHRS